MPISHKTTIGAVISEVHSLCKEKNCKGLIFVDRSVRFKEIGYILYNKISNCRDCRTSKMWFDYLYRLCEMNEYNQVETLINTHYLIMDKSAPILVIIKEKDDTVRIETGSSDE